MLLIEVNLTLDQKRKLLRVSKATGKSFGELASQALADLLEEPEQTTTLSKTVPKAGAKLESGNGHK